MCVGLMPRQKIFNKVDSFENLPSWSRYSETPPSSPSFFVDFHGPNMTAHKLAGLDEMVEGFSIKVQKLIEIRDIARDSPVITFRK